VRICVPEILSLWHPFTVCAAPGDDHTVRILFRQYGPFTRGSASRLRDVRRPIILVDEYYRDTGRREAAGRHAAVVMVARGIWVISYVSKVAQLQSALGNERRRT